MQEIKIPFNRPFMIGSELGYISEAVESGKISGDGLFSSKCHQFFQQILGFKKVLLTTSCTDALEMCAILLDINPGDEVIAPSYTFVSTVNAFILRGAKIKFVDSTTFNPNMDVNQIETLITSKTKVILPVHYAGISCDMGKIMQLANKYGIAVVEDAAQAISSFYKNENGDLFPLGSLGKLAAFSFHETKNVISGEGGLIAINDTSLSQRAEIIREKGTNRSAFFRGEVDKYGWVDIGSSFLPSDLIAAFLYAQLEKLDVIQKRRMDIWNLYDQHLKPLSERNIIQTPNIPEYAIHNAHMYYIITKSLDDRDNLIFYLKKRGINAVFHYQSLHSSNYFKDKHDGRNLNWSDHYSERLLRLPFFYTLSDANVELVAKAIFEYYI